MSGNGVINRGGYSQECPEGIHQYHYAAGGHPGCGGYIEALEIETLEGPLFVLQQYRSDDRGNVYRWVIVETGAELDELWESAWSIANEYRRVGISEWVDYPVWESQIYKERQNIRE